MNGSLGSPRAPRPRVSTLSAYGALLAAQLRTSVTTAAAYRFQFILDGVLAVLWIGTGVVPLVVAFDGRRDVGGWTFDQSLVVVGLFTILKAILDGAVNPSLVAIVNQIRTGTLDFVLIKPKDAQFLVCTAKFELWRGIDLLAGVAILVVALSRLGRTPGPFDVALAVGLLFTAIVILYSVWLLVVTSAFWVVRLDNLAFMFNALFDFARWPRAVMRGVLSIVFTLVLPLAVMTSFPAEALFGTLSARDAALAVGLAVVFSVTSRLAFRRALAQYTSASS